MKTVEEILLGTDPEAAIIERMKIVCNCKAIRKGRVVEVIASGASTLAEVNERALTGRGPCGATRCRPRIIEMLEIVKKNGN
jgi:NAD(P)H-nitrite reductase large subunit